MTNVTVHRQKRQKKLTAMYRVLTLFIVVGVHALAFTGRFFYITWRKGNNGHKPSPWGRV